MEGKRKGERRVNDKEEKVALHDVVREVDPPEPCDKTYSYYYPP